MIFTLLWQCDCLQVETNNKFSLLAALPIKNISSKSCQEFMSNWVCIIFVLFMTFDMKEENIRLDAV